MKIILFCNDQGNQRALAVRLHHEVSLHSIVQCDFKPKKISSSVSLYPFLQKFLSLMFGGILFRRVWFHMLKHYDFLYPKFPFPPKLHVTNINSKEVIKYISDEKPDLVLVSGTNLLRTELIDHVSRYGKIMNLHTGISPYVKGGPNCTNWCLYLRKFNLIGNTIMWLDSGIDTGNLIATARAPLSGNESLLELHICVMDHAHDLYIDVVRRYISCHGLANIPQSTIAEGKLFMTRDWGVFQVLFALINFYLFFRPDSKYLVPDVNVRLVTNE
jgi:methionyl-tRNA formyltransferase